MNKGGIITNRKKVRHGAWKVEFVATTGKIYRNKSSEIEGIYLSLL